MAQLTFSEADRQALHRERFEHPHPRVQQRMEVLWLVSQGLVYAEAARLAGVSDATADRYVARYRQGGLDALREFQWRKPQPFQGALRLVPCPARNEGLVGNPTLHMVFCTCRMSRIK